MKQSALLKRILAAKRSEAAKAERAVPILRLKESLAGAPPIRNFREAVTRRRPYQIHLIAELKKASPLKGVLRDNLDVAGLAKEFSKAGASALSILTETKFFQGAMEHVMQAKQACGLPALRKDFIVEEYQLFETRLAGADAILLIAGLLAQKKLKEFIATSRNLSLTPLVEVHSAAELKRALDAGADTIGINTRDLGTFKINFDVLTELRPKIPAGCVVIAESGVDSAKQIQMLRELRFDAVLIGEALMRSRRPLSFIHELLHT